MEEEKDVSFSKLKSKSKDPDSLEEKLEPCLFNINLEGLEKIHAVGLDMNSFFLLHVCLTEEIIDVDKINVIYSTKFSQWLQKLIRKQYITDEGKITISGRDLYRSIAGCTKSVEIKPKQESGFDRWWKVYPGTDDFSFKGVSFKGSRSLRTNKKLCRIKFEALINEGDYTEQELIESLELEVDMKKNQSYETRTNKLTFMQNSATYLNQRTFESFVEKIRNKETITKSKGNNITLI